jgi:hypothetical protein
MDDRPDFVEWASLIQMVECAKKSALLTEDSKQNSTPLWQELSQSEFRSEQEPHSFGCF